MMYTLWSHGELLGESALDYVRVFRKVRTGDLELTEKGLTAMERLSQTHEDCYRNVWRLNRERSVKAVDESDEQTLYADLAAEHDQYEALALELRAPNGTVIPTESIHVTDTDYLLRLGSERDEDDESQADNSTDDGLDPGILAELEDQLAECEAEHPPWLPEAPERPPVRFQLYVMLTDEWSIP